MARYEKLPCTKWGNDFEYMSEGLKIEKMEQEDWLVYNEERKAS